MLSALENCSPVNFTKLQISRSVPLLVGLFNTNQLRKSIHRQPTYLVRNLFMIRSYCLKLHNVLVQIEKLLTTS